MHVCVYVSMFFAYIPFLMIDITQILIQFIIGDIFV